jgi:DNA-binding MarR family transcriptional regulator
MQQNNLYEVIWETRRLFQSLALKSNELLQPQGINASMRAVLEFLDREEPQTVPQMAKARDVSRQHIQKIVNELLKEKLVEIIQNPAHKRSSLIQRTKQGKKCFNELKQREEQLFKEMARSFSDKDLHSTALTLRSLRDFLNSDTCRKLIREL